MLMHRTLKEMPGPAAEMTAIVARWDPATFQLELVSCGHEPPIVIHADQTVERVDLPVRRGLGGRASPRPSELTMTLSPGERLVLCSDGVFAACPGQAGLGHEGVAEAALRSVRGSAADTVRQVHRAVLDAIGEDLRDDATVVCLGARVI